MHKITIMSKPGCKLCKKPSNVVQHIIGSHVPAIIEEVDITKDQDLLEKYKNDIPVILVDDVERFRGAIDPDALARLFMDEPGERLLGIT